MPSLVVQPAASLQGTLTLPGDKSISHRALLIGALARGTTQIRHCLSSGDLESTRHSLEALGVSIQVKGDTRLVKSAGAQNLRSPHQPLDMGNSGTTTRLLMGILAGQSFSTTLTGDAFLQRRPMARVTKPLSEMGAQFTPKEAEYLPLTIHGANLLGKFHLLLIPSAQVKSALLLAGLFAKGETTIQETTPTRDHTERMLRFFGVEMKINGSEISVSSGRDLIARDLEIPGDISSAAFFLVAAAIVPNSAVTVKNVGLNPTRTGFLDVLEKMGAKVERFPKGEGDWEPIGDVTVSYNGPLKKTEIKPDEIPSLIDELPILMVAATQAKGQTLIKGAGELRVKETDRIASMADGLLQMGARIQTQGDDVVIEGPSVLKGNVVSSYQDHRTAMSLAVAALVAQGETTIKESQWIDISFPGFMETLQTIRR